MSRHNLVETLMGAVVLVAAGGFLAFAYKNTELRSIGGYELNARFDRVDGLPVGADVRISGIKVGTVVSQRLDTNTYQAVVGMSIEKSVKLPEDSMAKIASSGLLGGNYLALSPGASDDMLKPGEEITETQGSVDLLTLLSKFASGSGSSSSDHKASSDHKE
ncbi:outer membrane lipid asymmetry maintenance protein MlaD [Govanella unica]|uniref:Outer membrane lipid asymmetry maintenance protein MlaD n=1 Tax=Govanella unica TaxID=2975056 RepID=A0A9X3Z6T5_9PROT|nr:outer membrane lipid asymmetry maintenance protein MlaD [Govania unica]MDA5193530.1 outer membrane lipid asymmetry maintenance protein MlaD [Govania unica]